MYVHVNSFNSIAADDDDIKLSMAKLVSSLCSSCLIFHT